MTSPISSPRARAAKIIALVIAVIAIATLAYFWSNLRAYSATGAAYAARVVCSCQYVGNRGFEDCKKDLEPGMEIVWLSQADDGQRIEAYVPLMAEDGAEFRPGYGCVLDSNTAK